MTQETFQYLSGPLTMIFAGNATVDVLESQLKVVAMGLQDLNHDDLAQRVYQLRFAEEMAADKLKFEVKTIIGSMRRRL